MVEPGNSPYRDHHVIDKRVVSSRSLPKSGSELLDHH